MQQQIWYQRKTCPEVTAHTIMVIPGFFLPINCVTRIKIKPEMRPYKLHEYQCHVKCLQEDKTTYLFNLIGISETFSS